MVQAIVVPKLTLVQADLHRYLMTESELRIKYEHDHKDPDRIFGSHERQLETLALLAEHFPFVYREEFNKSVAESVDLVISAGGDDHLKYVSHYLGKTPVVGLNTDPQLSSGNLLQQVNRVNIDHIVAGEYQVEEQTRIEALLNDDPAHLAMSIYALGRDEDSDGNFRYQLEVKGKSVTHPITTGVTIYAGNGVEDWTRGAGKYLGSALTQIGPGERKIGWVVREPRDYELLHGVIGDGEEIRIICHKEDSKMTPDAIREHKIRVQSGDVMTFRVSDMPLYHARLG